MKYIQTNNALKPNGHYAQAVEQGGFLFLSGILPFHRETGAYVEGTVEEQMREILANLDSILQAGGSSRLKVLKTTIYISDMEEWGRVNKSYQEYFEEHTPARSIVAVSNLHFGAHLEMEAIAWV
ncbi:MAG: RidA family protein [Lachnospiraceae bacterium]|nr:RidA family protein [Lachnospiraceae bacterium]